jgi:hypothetical protein
MLSLGASTNTSTLLSRLARATDGDGCVKSRHANAKNATKQIKKSEPLFHVELSAK